MNHFGTVFLPTLEAELSAAEQKDMVLINRKDDDILS